MGYTEMHRAVLLLIGAVWALAGAALAVPPGSPAPGLPSSGAAAAPNLYQVQSVWGSAYNPEGDSITAGTAASGFPTFYTSRIAADIGATVTNRAIGGAQACDMADLQTFAFENPGQVQNVLYTVQIGTNDANVKGTGAYEAVYNLCHRAAIAWLAVPSTFKVMAPSMTTTGTWSADTTYTSGAGNGEQSTTNGSTLTGSITTFGAPIYVWYRVKDSWAGTFTYAVDGGSPVSVNSFTTPAIAVQNGGTQGVGLLRIPVSVGVHAIVFTVTSATNASNVVSILGIGTASNLATWNGPRVYVGGVPKQQNDLKSSITAQYDADAQANVALLQSDGLKVFFVPIRNFLNSTTDMNSTNTPLHPNDAGMAHLRDAYESVMQPVPAFSGLAWGNVAIGTNGGASTFPLTVSGAASNGTFGSTTEVLTSNASETGLEIRNTATGGRSYGFLSTASASGLGGSRLCVADFSSGGQACRLTVQFGGGIGIGTNTNAAGVILEVNGKAKFDDVLQLASFTVATLPAAGTIGREAIVTDANAACTYGATPTGGGSTKCKVWDNGTGWVEG